MLDNELSKDLKKPPVVEYEIPKRILKKQDSEGLVEDSLMIKLWDF
jgi:U3 small nucleolar RNA-associated protein 19